MTTTKSSSIRPSNSSYDPHLLKILASHHQQESSAKEFVEHPYYYNHPPPNTVATNLPRHLLGNGSSKLNTENSTSNLKFSSSSTIINGKIDQQHLSTNSQIKQSRKQQAKEALDFDEWLQPPVGSMIQQPPCLQSDTSTSLSAEGDFKIETILSSGECITCFLVGGEKRLCLPEILNTVLKDFSLQEINAACERLHIYCSRCTNEQLDILKLSEVLPMNAPSCGLITQTDAERLCANLFQSRSKGQLRTVNSIGMNPYERLYSIKVQHKCFGKCSGTLYPTLYVAIHAECIQCDTCQALFSAKTFVSHGHKSEENRICHWGFNSDNWRAYLKIRSTEDKKAREEFELFKEKFFNSNQTQKKRFKQSMECLIPTEKHSKVIPTSSDAWSTNNSYSNSQTTFSSTKKDNHLVEYSFGSSCLPRPALIPPSLHTTLPIESLTTTNSCPRLTSLRVVRSISPSSNDSTNPSITNLNNFSPDGIRQIVESTVSSLQGRQQLFTYISQLQAAAYAYSSKTNSIINQNQQNETILLRRENELLRERLLKLEKTQISSNSSTMSSESKISLSDHNDQHDSIIGDLDELESNISLQSISSSIVYQSTFNDQPKYFHRKRRLLAAEQEMPSSETEISFGKKSSPYKKACLDQIVDSLNQKAQTEQEENCEIGEHIIKIEQDIDDEEEEEEEIVVITINKNLTSPLTMTIEKEDDDEDIHIDDGKLTIDEH